ncbi:ubiquitin-like domain-containing protein [Bacillaceae bacterium W0354]
MNTTGDINPKRRRFDNKKIIITLLSAFVFIASIGYIVYEVMTHEVTVIVNGEEITKVTAADTVNELMNEIDVNVKEHDALSVDLHTELEEGMVITYDSAKRVFVSINDDRTEYYTTKDTVEELLKDKNIALNEHDEVSVSLNRDIFNGMHVAIAKAFEVTVNDGGEVKKEMVTNQTVEELLGQLNIKLSELDKLNVDLKDKVNKNREIKITRVTKEVVTEEQEIPYKTETRNDRNLEKGKSKVIQQGKEGKKVLTYELTKENGEVVSRDLVDEEVVEASKNKIVARGTKENIQLITNNESEVLKEFYASATAYTAYCNGCSGITRTGINLKANPHMKVIAVDPSVIPLGSKVWVEGYGYAIAGDTGGAIKGNRIDLHVPTKAEAYRYGRKQVRVKVFKK